MASRRRSGGKHFGSRKAGYWRNTDGEKQQHPPTPEITPSTAVPAYFDNYPGIVSTVTEDVLTPPTVEAEITTFDYFEPPPSLFDDAFFDVVDEPVAPVKTGSAQQKSSALVVDDFYDVEAAAGSPTVMVDLISAAPMKAVLVEPTPSTLAEAEVAPTEFVTPMRIDIEVSETPVVVADVDTPIHVEVESAVATATVATNKEDEVSIVTDEGDVVTADPVTTDLVEQVSSYQDEDDAVDDSEAPPAEATPLNPGDRIDSNQEEEPVAVEQQFFFYGEASPRNEAPEENDNLSLGDSDEGGNDVEVVLDAQPEPVELYTMPSQVDYNQSYLGYNLPRSQLGAFANSANVSAMFQGFEFHGQPSESGESSATEETNVQDQDPESGRWSESSDDEMRNFFPATRPGFKEVAGRVNRVTRADFEDYNRRRHLECFERSMENWRKFDDRQMAYASTQWLNMLDYDRYREIFVDIDVESLTPLDQYIYHLLTSPDVVEDQESLNALMAKLRRRFHITPSKRDIFERLYQLQREGVQIDENAAIYKRMCKVYNLDQIVSPMESVHSSINTLSEVQSLEEQSVESSIQPDQIRTVKLDGRMQHLLRVKATRSNSGVVVITVLTAPGKFSCTYDCYYCPNEPGQPRSYLSTEPAVLRANQNDFDALRQFYDRAMTLFRNGHVIDKIELLVLGGTWSGYPRHYKEQFCRDLFYAANIFPAAPEDARERKSLLEEQTINETAECRVIGLTLETRPDRINPVEIKHLRKLGCTRVQLGIQHVDDDVLQHINRGHTIKDTMNALYLLKENCYKVDIHIMPDLPSSSPEMDMDMFAQILSDKALQADQWKIYPCEVAPFSRIEEWHKEGLYVPYFDTDSTLMTNLLMRVKRSIHPWIRLNRVIRDIPNPSIIAGTNVTNMRQVVLSEMKQRSIACHCIRCREVKDGSVCPDPKLMIRQYETLGGTEFFLSYENEDESKIYGFLRLRLRQDGEYNPKVSLFQCLENCALVREVHVYGAVVAHGQAVSDKSLCQHRGLGASLLLVAEIIAAANGIWKMAVIAGIGTREYYAKHGYVLEDTYMTKSLSSDSISKRFEAQKEGVMTTSFRIPDSIRICAVDLNDAARTLRLPLPVPIVGREPPQPEFKPTEGDDYSINVESFLCYARATNDNNTKKPATFAGKCLSFFDGAMDYLGKPLKFIKENKVLVASVAFLTVACLMRLRSSSRSRGGQSQMVLNIYV